jgi:hypothetical protein
MSSQEAAYTSPQWGGNTAIGQRDSGHLAVPSSSAAVRHRAGAKPTRQWNEAMGKPRQSGAYANQRLNLAKLGRPMEERPGLQTGPGKSGSPAL